MSPHHLARLTLAIWACSPTSTTFADAPSFSMSGQIRYHGNGLPVPGVIVRLHGPLPAATVTDHEGRFEFSALGQDDWRIEPTGLGENHVASSSLDAAYALQRSLALRVFTTEQELACDVTGNGHVNSLDAEHILQRRVGLRESFDLEDSCGTHWWFQPIPEAVPGRRLESPSTETCQAGTITFEPLVGSVVNQDFVAVLTGDCTGNWTPSNVSTPTPTDTRTNTPIPTSQAPSPTSTTPVVTPTAALTASLPPAPTITSTYTPTQTTTATTTVTSQPTPSPTVSPIAEVRLESAQPTYSLGEHVNLTVHIHNLSSEDIDVSASSLGNVSLFVDRNGVGIDPAFQMSQWLEPISLIQDRATTTIVAGGSTSFPLFGTQQGNRFGFVEFKPDVLPADKSDPAVPTYRYPIQAPGEYTVRMVYEYRVHPDRRNQRAEDLPPLESNPLIISVE